MFRQLGLLKVRFGGGWRLRRCDVVISNNVLTRFLLLSVSATSIALWDHGVCFDCGMVVLSHDARDAGSPRV